MKRIHASLGLAFLVAEVALATQPGVLAESREPVDPDTLRVLWNKADHARADFIPQGLLSELDLTSPETVDLSHLPLTESQQYDLRFFLFAEPDGPDGCFLPPISGRARLKGFKPLGLVELLASKPLTTTGVVRNIVPGWTTGVVRPANMIFVEVDEILRNADRIAIAGQRLVFIRHSGAEVVIDGKRYCSPKTDPFEIKVGSRVLLYGIDHESEVDRVRGRVFEIRDETVYPGPDSELREGKKPIPLWQLRQGMEELAQPGQ